MINRNWFLFWLFLILMVVPGCKDYNSLESIEILPLNTNGSDKSTSDLYVCESSASSGVGYRQFKVTGHYTDDDTEDLTNEVAWSTDASDDTVLSSVVPGLVRCTTAYGIIGILATYTLDNGNTTGSSDNESSTTELTDSAIVDAN